MASYIWHLKGNVSAGPNQGPAYRLDDDYNFVRVSAYCPSTKDGNLTYTIKADGIAVWDGTATLTNGLLDIEANVTGNDNPLQKGKYLTLDIDAAGARSDATIQLDLTTS